MHRPTIAVLWEVYRRHRWVLIASSVWLLVISGLSRAMPEGAFFDVLLFAMVSPLVIGVFLLFAYATDADIASRDSTFPTRMFTLPLTTRAMVGWPMIYGIVAIALAWLTVASLVLRPGGMNVQLWWPAVLLAAALAWLQALMWRPFGLPGLRIVAVVVAVVVATGVLIVVFGPRWTVHLPEMVVSLLLVSTIPPAYLVAVVGVSRARRGDQPDWQRLASWARNVAGWLSIRGRTFASPLQAQVWFEWRRNGLGLPIIAGLMILLMAVLIAINRHNPALTILLLPVPLVVALSLGGIWGRCGSPRGGPSLTGFLATRPMSCAEMVRAKMKAAAISVVVVWGMTLAAVVLMVLWARSWAEMAVQFSLLTKDLSAVQRAVMVILAVVLLLAGTWKPMIVNLYLGLTGRRWVGIVWCLVMCPASFALILLAAWIYKRPEYHDSLLASFPWALGTAVVLKILLAGWSVRALHQRRLLEGSTLVRLLGFWLIGALALIALLGWLLPPDLAPWYLVVLCVVLVLPLARLSLAPLALQWNRHR